jgi:hypothetical protein
LCHGGVIQSIEEFSNFTEKTFIPALEKVAAHSMPPVEEDRVSHC